MKILKLMLSAIIAWTLGLAFIAATLYFTNNGADFTATDLMGFGTLAVAAWGLLMLVLYLPSLYWLKRRRGGINRKMVLAEALGFMATFLIIGSVFGLGFTWVQSEAK